MLTQAEGRQLTGLRAFLRKSACAGPPKRIVAGQQGRAGNPAGTRPCWTMASAARTCAPVVEQRDVPFWRHDGQEARQRARALWKLHLFSTQRLRQTHGCEADTNWLKQPGTNMLPESRQATGSLWSS